MTFRRDLDVEKSREPRRRAASRKRAICDCSERETATAKASAITRNPASTITASSRPPEVAEPAPESSDSTATRSVLSLKSGAVKVAMR